MISKVEKTRQTIGTLKSQLAKEMALLEARKALLQYALSSDEENKTKFEETLDVRIDLKEKYQEDRSKLTKKKKVTVPTELPTSSTPKKDLQNQKNHIQKQREKMLQKKTPSLLMIGNRETTWMKSLFFQKTIKFVLLSWKTLKF